MTGAADGGTGACRWVFGEFRLDVGLDWRAIQTVFARACQQRRESGANACKAVMIISEPALAAMTMRLGGFLMARSALQLWQVSQGGRAHNVSRSS